MTASAMATQVAAAPETVTVVVTEAPATAETQPINSAPSEIAIAEPEVVTVVVRSTGSIDAATSAETGPATPTYQVVAEEKPATTKSSGS